MIKMLEESRYFRVNFKNKTSERIQVAIRFKEDDGSWITRGWFNIEAGEKSYVAKTKNATIYYHAESTSGSWSGDDRYYSVRGSAKEYGFREKTAAESHRGDEYIVSLSD